MLINLFDLEIMFGGFFSKKNVPAYLSKEEVMKKILSLKFSLENLHIYLSVLGLGVISGFILRRYFRLLLVSFLISFFILKGLEFQKLVKIEWKFMWDTFGLDPNTSFEELAKEVYKFVTTNIYLSLAGCLGFFIGYRAAQ